MVLSLRNRSMVLGAVAALACWLGDPLGASAQSISTRGYEMQHGRGSRSSAPAVRYTPAPVVVSPPAVVTAAPASAPAVTVAERVWYEWSPAHNAWIQYRAVPVTAPAAVPVSTPSATTPIYSGGTTWYWGRWLQR